MKGPYAITATLGKSSLAGGDTVKREAIRKCRRLTKKLGVTPDGTRATGNVVDADEDLVRQVEAYRTPSGTVKVRDVEI